MVKIEELLIKTIEKLEFPIFRQGSLNPEDSYPESFFTFWNNDTYGDNFYDNKERSYVWYFDLNFYSNDPALVNSELLKAKELLNKKGFITSGKGHDVASDEPTHTGKGIHVTKIEEGGN